MKYMRGKVLQLECINIKRNTHSTLCIVTGRELTWIHELDY